MDFNAEFKKYVDKSKFEMIQCNDEYHRIAIWNVHLWKDYLNRNNFDEIINVIKNINADVIGLVEAVFFKKGINKVDFIGKVNEIGYKYIHMCNSIYGINIIISKYKMTNVKILSLTKDPVRNQSRYALLGNVNINNKIIPIVCTHLDVYDSTEECRLHQIKDIIKSTGDDYIIIGDFNSLNKSDYSENEWKIIESADKLINNETHHKVTDYLKANKFYDSFTKSKDIVPKVTVWTLRRVDYMWIGKNFAHKIKKCFVYPTLSSDHFPVIMDIKI